MEKYQNFFIHQADNTTFYQRENGSVLKLKTLALDAALERLSALCLFQTTLKTASGNIWAI